MPVLRTTGPYYQATRPGLAAVIGRHRRHHDHPALQTADRTTRPHHRSGLDAGRLRGVVGRGAERLSASGYFCTKGCQEKLIEDSPIPYSIVHATQFFEFVGRIADAATSGTTGGLARVAASGRPRKRSSDPHDAAATAALTRLNRCDWHEARDEHGKPVPGRQSRWRWPSRGRVWCAARAIPVPRLRRSPPRLPRTS